ncbi:hypothetical protein MSMAC_1846 [Methanosarcina mazei C16]|nr:glycosyltransferase family 1 protein [Methanosarcina mazei]AKB71736.1 hypothetical protein MSMAC_1846 [Methanosarcina mazei C16]
MEGKLTPLVVDGNPYHSEVIKKTLSEIEGFEIREFRDSKNSPITYWISGAPSLFRNISFWLSNHQLLIMHWIGTDVLYFTGVKKEKGLNLKFYNYIKSIIIRYKTQKKQIIHLAGAPWLADELSEAGIRSRYFPITTIDPTKLINPNNHNEKEIDFISYVPLRDFEFYGGNVIIRLANKYKNYKFLIIHPDVITLEEDHISKYPSNVNVLPKVDFKTMQELYSKSKFFLRFTEHDGLSLSVLEALYFKLQVLWTYSFPHVYHIKNNDILIESLPDIVNEWRPNDEGHEYVLNNYSINVWKKDFSKLIQDLTKK